MTTHPDVPARAAIRVRPLTLFLAIPTTFASVVVLLALPDGPRAVAAPLCAIVNVAVWFLVVLWNRDSALPVFEVGPVSVGITALYSAYPLFAFLMAGGVWTTISDNRLLQRNPDWEAVGGFAWRSVIYLGAFALVYATFRGRATADRVPLRKLSGAGTLVVLWLFAAITTYFAALWIQFGVTYDPSYRDVQLGLVGGARDLPYVLQQVSHNLKAILLILKLCGIAILMRLWRHPASRIALVAWLAAECVATALRMGARSDAVVLVLGAVLLYHRLVRRLGVGAMAMGAALVGAVLLYGFARDIAAPAGGATATYWSAANEFQILFGTAYDLYAHKMSGALDAIPWQVYASDALRLVPSQLLPVPKIEPADWYLQEVGLAGGQLGLMFGVVAQAVIGGDWIELMARGAVLGLIFALIHRTYVRNAESFWVTLAYLYICVWSYYTFRASTFYFLYVVLYRFVPAMIAVRVGAGLVRRASGFGAPAGRTAPVGPG